MLRAGSGGDGAGTRGDGVEPAGLRPDLEAVIARHEQGGRTARENLDDLLDPGKFLEYRPLIFVAQEGRRPRRELVQRTPADGLIGASTT